MQWRTREGDNNPMSNSIADGTTCCAYVGDRLYDVCVCAVTLYHFNMEKSALAEISYATGCNDLKKWRKQSCLGTSEHQNTSNTECIDHLAIYTVLSLRTGNLPGFLSMNLSELPQDVFCPPLWFSWAFYSNLNCTHLFRFRHDTDRLLQVKC